MSCPQEQLSRVACAVSTCWEDSQQVHVLESSDLAQSLARGSLPFFTPSRAAWRCLIFLNSR